MNTGAYFAIGKTHTVCQDYCEAKIEPGIDAAIAVLADGCSSSPDTDFGARFLSRIYSKHLGWVISPINNFEDSIAYAERLISDLSLDPYCMDATLLAACAWRGEYKIHAAGDGVFAKIMKDGVIEATTIEYPSGAPFYLNYHLNEQRKKMFVDYYGMERVIKRFKVYSDGVEAIDVNRDTSGEVYVDSGKIDDVTAICLMSDGVESFYRMVDTGPSKAPEAIGLPEVLRKLLDFKGYQGEFVARRMQRFAKDCDKLGWHHGDDLSLAVIACHQQ